MANFVPMSGVLGGSSPTVSIVIPVRNRRALLARCLAALDAQTVGGLEVVVVDDGSTDGSGDLAAGTTVAGRPVVVVRGDARGAVAARTLGVSVTTAPVLAFTDSDCEPDPVWLKVALDEIDDGADLVHGRTVPARPVGPLERSMDSAEDGLFPTCNVVYRRAAFEAAGGFDVGAAERLGFRVDARAKGLGFGEDTLLGWRVVRAGGDVRYREDAVVRHHVFEADFLESVSRTWMMAAFPALLAEVPELQDRYLRKGVLFGGTERVPLYATVAAAALRRPAAAGAAAAWWTASRARGRWRRPATVPQAMALDVVAAAALAVGSARARLVAL